MEVTCTVVAGLAGADEVDDAGGVDPAAVDDVTVAPDVAAPGWVTVRVTVGVPPPEVHAAANTATASSAAERPKVFIRLRPWW
jgi:hypothetical protein